MVKAKLRTLCVRRKGFSFLLYHGQGHVSTQCQLTRHTYMQPRVTTSTISTRHMAGETHERRSSCWTLLRIELLRKTADHSGETHERQSICWTLLRDRTPPQIGPRGDARERRSICWTLLRAIELLRKAAHGRGGARKAVHVAGPSSAIALLLNYVSIMHITPASRGPPSRTCIRGRRGRGRRALRQPATATTQHSRRREP